MKLARVPIAVPFELRAQDAGAISHDPYLVNAFIERQKDGRVLAIKRAGSLSAYQYNSGGATNGQGTAYYQNMIWAMGSNVLYNVTATGNGSTDGTAWTASTSAPWKGRSSFGYAVLNGQIIITGGTNTASFTRLNDVWGSYDGVNWTQLVSAAPWSPRATAANNLVVLGNTLYLVGGTGPGAPTYLNDVWSTQDGVNWTQVVGSAPWAARTSGMVTAFNQGIILMGGGNASGDFNDVWFSPDGATWSELVANASWSARTDAGCIVYGNKLWVMGGVDAALTHKQDVWSSLDGITWTNTGNMPAVRAQMGLAVYAGKIWVFTGYDGTTTGTTTVWSTTDGITFTVATSNYGGSAVYGGALIPYKTPSSVSTINAPTLWYFGGYLGGTSFTGAIYRGSLNVLVASSYTPTGTRAATTEQWHSTTQNAGQYIIWKNTKDAWVYWAGVLQKITSTNYPTSTVAGIVNLDDTIYVMDINGVIYGSNLSDPFTWSALNFITADYEADKGIMIVKYQNYILALKSSSMQLFYDAGRYPGSPLLPAIQYNAQVGCVSADTVVGFNNTVIWVARTDEFGPFVVAMNGATAQRISTPWVDLMLGQWGPSAGADYATSARIGGHYFYYLSLHSLNVTLVYDFTEKEWHIAKSSTNATYDVCNYVTDGQFDYMQSKGTGNIWQLTPTAYSDATGSATTQAITVVIQTTKFDGGTNRRKFIGPLTVIGDLTAAGSTTNNLLVQWSDDDGQTFNSGVTVDMTKQRPRIARNGSFFRRQWKLTHTVTTTPLRLEALEVEMPGA